MTGLLRYFGEMWGYTVDEILRMTIPQLNAIMDSLHEDSKRAKAAEMQRAMKERLNKVGRGGTF